MKKIFVFSLLALTYSLLPLLCGAQNKYVDSLKADLKVSRVDSNSIKDLSLVAGFYYHKNFDRVMFYINQVYELTEKLEDGKFKEDCLRSLSMFYHNNQFHHKR